MDINGESRKIKLKPHEAYALGVGHKSTEFMFGDNGDEFRNVVYLMGRASFQLWELEDLQVVSNPLPEILSRLREDLEAVLPHDYISSAAEELLGKPLSN